MASYFDYRHSSFNTHIERDQLNIVNCECAVVAYHLAIINRICLMPQSTATDQILRKLEPPRIDASIRPECLAETRADLLEAIGIWVFLQSERVFWLYGLPGSGKSTVATTIVNFFREQNRLGASVFCNRNIAERNEPTNVIRNIAYRLALFDGRIRDAIEVAIDNFPSIAESPLRLQFDKLLLEPLLKLPATEAPIVIVLDAFDECGNAESRAVLVALLAAESARLPAFIRILVTSRAEKDIKTAFIAQPHIVAHEIDVASESNSEDICYFYDNR
jgi:Cdc6-like AAA superfamily ATPase